MDNGQCYFELIDAERVPLELRELAERVSSKVRAELDLPDDFPIRWFQPAAVQSMESDERVFVNRVGVCGVAMPYGNGEAWLRLGHSVEETMLTLAHELRHLWQMRNNYEGICRHVGTDYPSSGLADNGYMETDARAFEKGFRVGRIVKDAQAELAAAKRDPNADRAAYAVRLAACGRLPRIPRFGCC